MSSISLAGADVVTLPPEILGKMMKHPLTEYGLDSFLNDWKKIDKGLVDLISDEAGLSPFVECPLVYWRPGSFRNLNISSFDQR